MMEVLFWLLRRLALLGIYIAIQHALYKRIVVYLGEFLPDEARRKRVARWVKVFLVGISLPILVQLSPYVRMHLPKTVAAVTLYPFAIWLPSSVCIFLLLISQEALQALTQRRLGRSAPETAAVETGAPAEMRAKAPGLPRREFMRLSSTILATSPIAAFTYGMSISKTNFKIEEVTIPIKDLPKSLNGLRICQLTDIHYESFVFPEDLMYVVKMANDLKPDLTFLTGDFLTDQSAMAQPFIEVFRELKAKEGIYGCFGNHENYTQTHDIFTREFRKKGIEMLRDQVTDLHLRGEKISLAAIDWVGRRLRPQALATIHAAVQKYPTILLSHQPNMFPIAAAAGVDLTLSGHTHGGQIALELVGFKFAVSQIVSPYSAGLYEDGASKLYVSRGIGTVALPLRVNAPPEITLIKLVSA